MAIKEKRWTVRSTIEKLLPGINLLDAFWANIKCPECKDDHDFYFIISKDFYKVDEKRNVQGGYICLDCGWSNAGSIHESELPDDYNATYPKS